MSQLTDILFEAAWSNSIIPFGHEPTFYALKAFGGHDMLWPVVMAVTGATLGQAFNWFGGKALSRFKYTPKKLGKFNQKLFALFNQYGFWLALFSWVPMCKLLVFLVGLTPARFRIVLLLLLIGQLYNYGSVFFS